MRETTTGSDTPEIDQMTETLIEITAGAHAPLTACPSSLLEMLLYPSKAHSLMS